MLVRGQRRGRPVGLAVALILALTYLTGAPTRESGATTWSQFGANAQRTAFVPESVPLPWRWKWGWNGPSNNGRVRRKVRLPRNIQPIVGNGRVYVAAGKRGLFAVSAADGQRLWRTRRAGRVYSSPAHHAATDTLFVVNSLGTVHALQAGTGELLRSFAGNAPSTLPLPPALVGDRVFVSIGSRVLALDTATLTPVWSYDAESPVDTPPAYSATRNRVVVVTRDLYVHAIDNADGSRRWRVKPTPREPGDPGDNSNFAEARHGWPVIAEGHGIVFVRYRLPWQTLWTWLWPSSNAAMRANLLAQPEEQPLFALDLDDGTTAFVPNVGNGGFGDGGYLPMGPLPVVKRFDDSTEVAYVIMRGEPCDGNESACDSRADSHYGELLLDDTTVPGYEAGYVRFMEGTFLPTDEQPFLSMAGDQLLAGHWEVGVALGVIDRSDGRGAPDDRITTAILPHIATSQDVDVCGTGFLLSHYCGLGLFNTRGWPPGFYIYWKRGNVYDRYWTEYASWVVSDGTLYFMSTDGAVVALEHGDPEGPGSLMVRSATPVVPPRPTASAARTPDPVPETIPAAIAARYSGRRVTVRMPVRFVFNNRKTVYLGVQNPHRGAFKAMIPRSAWSGFGGAPERMFRPGDFVEVTGTVTWYQGDPAIVVSDPAQLRRTTGE